MDLRNKAFKKNFAPAGMVKLFVFLFSCFVFKSYATENPPAHNWTTKPFEQKVFIENKGQFDGKINNQSGKILFGCSNRGVEMYFTSKGLTYRHEESVPMTEREKEAALGNKKESEGAEAAEGKRMMKVVPHYLFVEWIGADPNAEIISQEQVSFYYTYGGSITAKARAFKKIIYKNMYPGIDIEYIFPEDSSGIKYSIIVNPGADASLIKMKYTGAEKISSGKEGSVEIKTSFGNFIDHAPVSFLDDHSPVLSSFAKNGNIITFNLQPYNKQRTLIIDPWTTNPVFTGYNVAYDIDYDLSGNVYVFGSSAPLQLTKLNSAGVIQWTFNAVGMGLYSGQYFYGDFAMDEVSGTSYLAEGFNNNGSPCRVFKVNSSGVQTGTFAGSGNMNEIWRAEYDRCLNQIILIGSGWPGPAYQAAILDTALTTLTPYNVLGCPSNEDTHDMTLLAIDNSNNTCFMATAKSYLFPGTYDNVIVKCSVPALAPSLFTVSDGHKFLELKSVNYIPYANGLRSANGMNGMSVSPNYLYTYDSDSLKRWDKNTGAYIAGMHISPVPATYVVVAPGSAIQIGWGGLSTDDCDNIYAGVTTSIKKYNTSLTLTNTFALTDTVFDVKAGPNNKLYACGKGFVTEITNINTTTPTVTTTGTPASGCNTCNGTATTNITGGCNPGPYTYKWMPGGQTTQTATGLCPGHYTVTITTGCVIIYSDTVTITGGSVLSTTLSSVAAACANNGSASVSVSGGTGPYTYSWSPSGQITSTASGLGGGVYTVTVTDQNLCSKTDTITVAATTVSYTLFPGIIKCYGDTTSIHIAVSGGTVTWNTVPIQTGLYAYGLSAGNYTGTITGGGCNITFSVTLNQPPQLTVTATNNSPVCSGATINLGCNAGISWAWNGPGGFTSTNQNPVIANAQTNASGIYTVSITDANNCTASDTTPVLVYPKPTAIAANNGPLCAGQTLNLTGSGGLTYTWTGPGGFLSTQQNPIIINVAAGGTYSLSITDNNGCSSDTTTLVVIKPAPVIDPISNYEYCPDVQTFSITLSSTPGGTLSSFFWSNNNTAIGLGASGASDIPSFTTVNTTSVAISSVITVHASFNGCTGPNSTFTITINPAPEAQFNVQHKICAGTAVVFNDSSLIGSGNIAQWNWDFNNDGIFTDAIATNPSYTFTTAGTYTIGLIVYSNKMCSDTAKEIVYVNPIPQSSFIGDTLQGCPVVHVHFTDLSTVSAPANITSWQWNFGNGTTFAGQFPPAVLYTNLSATQVYNYTVSLTVVSDSGCQSTSIKPGYIKVFPVPIADFSYQIDNQSDGIDATVYFTDQSTGATGVSWCFGDIFAPNQSTNYSYLLNPQHTYLYDQPYLYSVTEWVQNQYGCKDSITKSLEIKPGFTFYIPNAFSPNGDGTNDWFKGTGIGIDNSTYHLLIFDRWGNLIFKGDDLEKAWDGRVNGKGDIVQEDVYVWKVEFRELKGNQHQYTGTVSIVK